MSEQTITDLAEVRPGDWVKAEYLYRGRAHPLEGEAWEDGDGYLCVGVTIIRLEDGGNPSYIRFISASRPAPALPTEPGSVILASKVRDVELDPPMVLFRGHDVWWSPRHIKGCVWHRSRHVQEWAPAEVVVK